MKTAENQEVKTSRAKLDERLAKRFPDRDFSGKNVRDGQNVQELYDDSLEEMFGEYDAREAEYNSHSERLSALFKNEPRAAKVFMAWASGGDLMEQLIENFGDEFRDALDSEEGRNRFLDAQNRWIQKVADNRKADEEAAANFETSVATLQKFQQEHNLSDEEAIAVFDRVHKIGTDMVQGIYTVDSFLLALNAINHDKDVETARAEGQISGRNEKIREKLRDESQTRNLPPAVGGQGASAGEMKPKSRKRTALDMFGLND